MSAGIAFECARDGRVQRMLRAALETRPPITPGSRLAEAVADASHADLDVLLEGAWSRGAVFDRTLALTLVTGSPVTLHASAVRRGDSLLVVIVRTPAALLRMIEDLMRINNEQANALRETARTLAKSRSDPHRPEDELYEALSEVNNELANLQREMARKNTELERLNEDKNRLLGMAAHDLRTPLAVIQSYAEFLRDEAADVLDAEQREFVTTIHETSDYMRRLVDDLLEVSRIEAGKLVLELAPCDLSALVRRHVALQQILAHRKRIHIELEHDEPIAVLADAVKIGQLLHNLIGNATTYCPPDSVVSVTITTDARGARVAVIDQGPGIAPAERDKLFQPFATASNRGTSGEPSTGLGLAIARRIVQGHGGSIGVDSEPGQGATFWFSLPLADS